MSETRLHEELTQLAAGVAWPETPNLVTAAGARIEARSDVPRPHRGALRPAAAAVIALLLVIAVVPPARSAVLDLLGLTGGEEIQRVETVPPAQSRHFELGAPTSLAAARRAVDFPIRVPAALGTPSAVRLSPRIPGGMVSLVFDGRAVLSQFRGGATPYVRKLAGPGTRVRPVRVEGADGFFVSGAPPMVLVRGRDGSVVEGRPALDGASVLIWDRGDVAQRLELRGDLASALRIAASLR